MKLPWLRNFLIAFAVCLVLFSLLAFFIFQAVLPAFAGPDESDPSIPVGNLPDPDETPENPPLDPEGKDQTPTEQPITGETFAAIIGGKDMTTGKLDALALVKVDKEKKRFVFSSIPTDSTIAITGYDASGNSYSTPVSIGELLLYYDEAFLMNKIYALCGIPIDYYAIVDSKGFQNIVDAIGGVSYDVPIDMVYIGDGTPENPEINLAKGRQKLDGNKALQLMRFVSYPQDGAATRMRTQVSFLKTLFSDLLKPANITDAAKTMAALLKSCKTNFTLDDFKQNMDLLFHYPSFAVEQVVFPANLTTISTTAQFTLVLDTYQKYR